MSVSDQPATDRPASVPDTATRPLLTGTVTSAVAGVLMAAAYAGPPALGAAVFALQLLLTLAWLAALGVTGGLGAFGIAAGAGVAAVVVLLRSDGAYIGDLVGVVGIAMVASLLHQVARRHRTLVTMSIAGTMSAVLVAVAASTYVALRSGVDGRGATAAGLAGAGAAVLAARLVDAIIARPVAVPSGSRGWPGLVAGVAAGCGIGALYAWGAGGLALLDGLAIAGVAGACALAADLAVDTGAVVVTVEGDERQRSALVPTAMFLPLAMAAPAAYVTGRILLG